MEKTFGELSKEEIQEIRDNAVSTTTKCHKVRNENIQRYVSVKFPLIKSANFKYERRDFTPAFMKIT